MESALPWIVIAVVLAAVGVVVLLKMPRGKVAAVEVRPNEPFDLHCAPADDRPYKIWTRYQVAFTATGGHGKLGFGLVYDIEATVGDETILKERLGLGRLVPDGVQRICPDEFFTGTSRSGNDYVRAGTFVLAQPKSRAMGAPIGVRGVIRPAEGTAPKLLRIYIAP